MAEQLIAGAEGHPLWPELDSSEGDLRVAKNRFSAFLPGSSDIEAQLRRRGIDTVVIAGTLTNVCCESSARDAMMRNFHVIMLSDGNATYTDAIHNASLTSLSVTFADVMTTEEVLVALSVAVAHTTASVHQETSIAATLPCINTPPTRLTRLSEHQ